MQGTVFHDAAAAVTAVPVSLGGHSEGSIGIKGASISETALYAIAGLAAIAFERSRNRALLGRAEAARQSEELKSTLLDAIAHEFKTPLTSIKAAVTAMLPGAPADAGVRELLTIIDEESDRMDYLVSEAIEMARVEAGEIRLRREAHLHSGSGDDVAEEAALGSGRPPRRDRHSRRPASVLRRFRSG